MSAVLLINADMTPMHTIPLQRAISLISKGKVDVVESVPGRVLRSPSVTWAYPSVLRLRYYRNVPRRKMTYSRRAVFARDGYVCQYCGRKLSREDATLDHIIPVFECVKRGIKASTFSNSCCSCASCNARKGSRSMRDAGLRFWNPEFEPKTPRGCYLVLSSDFPESWRVYLKVGG